MKRIQYEVHSDVDENNVYAVFLGKGAKKAAIAYAKRHSVDQTWVDKVQYNDRTEDYQYLGGVWNYQEGDVD